jgi:RimJ/RimL family protein N-acetyltransferase
VEIEVIRLRNVQPEDARQLRAWLSENSSLQERWLGLDPDDVPLHVYDFDEVIAGRGRTTPDDFRYWQAVETVEGVYIGEAGLIVVDGWWDNAEFGLLIAHPDYQAKEYALAAGTAVLRLAFEQIKIWKLWLDVCNDEGELVELYQALGFRCEGVLRQQRRINGRRRDVALMGQTREDFYKEPLR